MSENYKSFQEVQNSHRYQVSQSSYLSYNTSIVANQHVYRLVELVNKYIKTCDNNKSFQTPKNVV